MKRTKPLTSLFIAVVALILIAVLWWLSFRHLRFEEVQAYTLKMQSIAVEHVVISTAVLLVIQMVGMFFTLPTKAIFNMVAGALLGFLPGAFVTIIGTLIGTSGLFFVSKKITPDHFIENLPSRLKQFEQKLQARPALTVMSLRLILALPYGAITIFSAVTGIRYRPFIIGSFIGDIPVVLLYAAAGSKLAELAGTDEALSPLSVVLLTAAGIGLFAGVFRPKKKLS